MHADLPGDRTPVSRRTRFATALVTLLVSLPSTVLGGLLVYGVGALFGPWPAVGLTLTWLLCGTLIPAPTAEMAPQIFRVRRPEPAEHTVLIPAWHNVTRAAGVRGAAYSLWIQDTDHLNALAAPGRIVVATGWAVAALGPRELEAVLAHELGHHLGGSQRAQMLSYWYALPIRGILGGYRRITWLFAVFVAKAAHVAGFVSLLQFLGVRKAIEVIGIGVLVLSRTLVLAAAAVGLLLVVGAPVAAPLALAIILEPFAQQAQRRRAELRADQVAVDLGYGPETYAVLDLWLRRQRPRRAPSRLARLLDSHPRIETRIRAVEIRMGHEPTE
ncbi:M48 family metalloprotease [Nocardia sp. NPDC050710]|uniref:M48 family metalloprotease n=1 Tax=Nocardia sp. NPDC050710 TaxID=3157220 RepID=UPI0033C25389